MPNNIWLAVDSIVEMGVFQTDFSTYRPSHKECFGACMYKALRTPPPVVPSPSSRREPVCQWPCGPFPTYLRVAESLWLLSRTRTAIVALAFAHSIAFAHAAMRHPSARVLSNPSHTQCTLGVVND